MVMKVTTQYYLHQLNHTETRYALVCVAYLSLPIIVYKARFNCEIF